MNILDENILQSQLQILPGWRIPTRQIGEEIGRKGLSRRPYSLETVLDDRCVHLRSPLFQICLLSVRIAGKHAEDDGPEGCANRITPFLASLEGARVRRTRRELHRQPGGSASGMPRARADCATCSIEVPKPIRRSPPTLPVQAHYRLNRASRRQARGTSRQGSRRVGAGHS